MIFEQEAEDFAAGGVEKPQEYFVYFKAFHPQF